MAVVVLSVLGRIPKTKILVLGSRLRSSSTIVVIPRATSASENDPMLFVPERMVEVKIFFGCTLPFQFTNHENYNTRRDIVYFSIYYTPEHVLGAISTDSVVCRATVTKRSFPECGIPAPAFYN